MSASPVPPERPAPGILTWPAQSQARGSIGLLHGVTSSAASWWRVAPALAAQGWDVTAIDLPGHGEGPRPKPGADPLASLVEGAVAALPPHLTVLVGHSLGAVVALATLSRYPDIAAGVVVEDPPGQSGGEAVAGGIEAMGQAVRANREAYWQRVRHDHPKWEDADVNQAVAAAAAADTVEIALALRRGLTWDLPGLVASVGVPLLAIVAPVAEQPPGPEGGSALLGADRQALQSLLPEDRFIVVDGGHSIHREQAQRVVELISDFAGTLAA